MESNSHTEKPGRDEKEKIVLGALNGALSKAMEKTVKDLGCTCKRPSLVQTKGKAHDICIKCGEPFKQTAPKGTPLVRKFRKFGRNEPCPCKSGKKWKKCHGLQYG
jgi:uncharacterized protein YecA (UPF0149 family)